MAGAHSGAGPRACRGLPATQCPETAGTHRLSRHGPMVRPSVSGSAPGVSDAGWPGRGAPLAAVGR
eukprot:200924-Hanusia_phi.AAC.1